MALFAHFTPPSTHRFQSTLRRQCFLWLATLSFLLGAVHLQAQTGSRTQIELSNSTWQFFGQGTGALPTIGSSAFDNANWTNVTVPHNFQSRLRLSNTLKGWYRRDITVPSSLAGKRLYLVFEGAAAVADVYVNGQHLAQHRGAYTRFNVDATSALIVGANNTIAVSVDDDSANTADLLPSDDRLYKVWGGLYRKVWLMATDPLHVDPTDFSSPGVYIRPSAVSSASATLAVEVLVRNSRNTLENTQVRATLMDPSNTAVQTLTGTITVGPNQRGSMKLNGTVLNPKLWSPTSPNLYHLVVTVLRGGQVVDSITEPTGFRSIQFGAPSRGFVRLNGSPILLLGADLHQEIESKGSAVSDADLAFNFSLIKDLGMNWVRLAHYPHARFEYDLCDQLGVLCWAENGHTNTDVAGPTADSITTEMVKQNYNHPSIVVWSVGNEAGTAVADREIPIVRALDPTRVVAVANMTAHGVDFRADNSYPGWYGTQTVWDFQTSGYISETGGGGVVTTHTDYADATRTVNTFEPEEYQQLLGEARFQSAIKNNTGALGMFTWWILRDFHDRKYKTSWNSKGLTTYAGDKKDVYYLYRCFLRPNTPTVHLTSKRYFLRRGSATNGIKAYSTAAQLTLTLNGQTVSTLSDGQYQNAGHTVNHVFYWPAALRTGKNTVTVSDGAGNSDSTVVYFQGSGGQAPLPQDPLVTNLTSSNSANLAFYIEDAVHEQWPVYSDLDSTADNSFDELPAVLDGTSWIATQRVTKTGQNTSLTFTVARAATVYVMATRTATAPAFLPGFTKTADTNLAWRNDSLILISADLYSRAVTAGTTVALGQPDRDMVVILKETGGNGVSTVYQAEDTVLAPTAGIEATNAGWSGNGYVNTDNVLGSFVEWKVSVPTAGNYKLDFRFANGTATNRPADLSVNNGVVQAGVSFPSTGVWTTWSDVVVTRALNAGTNVIRLTATTANGCGNLDKLTVSQ